MLRQASLFALMPGFVFAAGALTYEKQPLPAVIERVRQMPAAGRDRPAAFRQMLTEAGCPPAERPSADKRYPPEFEAAIGPADARPVLVIAHAHPNGVADNWTGLAMLASLCRSFRETRFRHRFVLASPGNYEEYVRRWAARPDKPLAAVDLAVLGLTAAAFSRGPGTQGLLQALRRTEKTTGVPIPPADVGWLALPHASHFQRGGIPVMLFHSFGPELPKRLEKGLEQVRNVVPAHYYNAYVMLATFLLQLDLDLP